MKPGFDFRDRSSLRRILRFVLLAVIIGLGVNTILSLFMDRTQIVESIFACVIAGLTAPGVRRGSGNAAGLEPECRACSRSDRTDALHRPAIAFMGSPGNTSILALLMTSVF